MLNRLRNFNFRNTRNIAILIVIFMGLAAAVALALLPTNFRGRAADDELVVCDDTSEIAATGSGTLTTTPIPTTVEERESRRDELRREITQRKEEIKESARERREYMSNWADLMRNDARARRDEIKQKLQERKRNLKELARTDARAAIEEIKSEKLEETIEIPTQNCIEQEKTVTGAVTTLYGTEIDSPTGEGVEVPLIITEESNIPLVGLDEQEQQDVLDASKVTVTGYEIDGEMLVDPETVQIEETNPNVLQANATSQTPTWKAIFLIYRNTNVRGVTASMPQSQIDNTIATINKVPGWVSSWSNGYAKMSVKIVEPTSKIQSVTPAGIMDGKQTYWVDPRDVKSDIDKYAPRGSYDSIFVVWRNDNGSGTIIPCNCGWTLPPHDIANGAGYTQIDTPDNGGNWMSTEAIFIHEWMHQVSGWLIKKGHNLTNLHSRDNLGYNGDEVRWLQDYMTGRVGSSISPALWKTSTPTGGTGSSGGGSTTRPTATRVPTRPPATPTPDTRRFTISGEIESTSGDGVRGARVTFYKKSDSGRYDLRCCSISTDSNGRFTLTNRTPGEYQATVTAPSGYRVSGSATDSFNLHRNTTVSFRLIGTSSPATPTTRPNQPTPTKKPVATPTRTSSSARPDLVVESFQLTDATGRVKTNFKVGERIYVKLVLANRGNANGNSSTGRTMSAFYINRSSTITQAGLPADPNDYYLRNGEFGAGYRKEYGSYPPHSNDGFFPDRKSWEMNTPGTYTARIFMDYDRGVVESNENNNQATVRYTIVR